MFNRYVIHEKEKKNQEALLCRECLFVEIISQANQFNVAGDLTKTLRQYFQV